MGRLMLNLISLLLLSSLLITASANFYPIANQQDHDFIFNPPHLNDPNLDHHLFDHDLYPQGTQNVVPPVVARRRRSNPHHHSWQIYYLSVIAYVELDDIQRAYLQSCMFADIVEKLFSCTTAQLMKYTAEEHRRFVDTTIFNLSTKKWTIHIYADLARMKSVKYKNYTIVSIEANED
ncbi:hypothetical protein CsatA_023333 [Cannabis sativa]